MGTKSRSTIMLDVDDSILNKKLLLDNSSADPQQEITQLLPDLAPIAINIKPQPGECVKTRDTSSGTKVFINVCTSGAIAPPQDITDQELIEILESDEPSTFKIPMSVGQGHEEKDKTGGSCTAYDVVVNTEFLTKTQNSPMFHNFFYITTMETLDQKYELALDKNNWKLLKNKLYLGTMSQQSVRTTMPMVQELTTHRPVTQPPSVANSVMTERASRSLQTDASDNIETLRPIGNSDVLGLGEQQSVNKERHTRLLSAVTSKKVMTDRTKRRPELVLRRLRDDSTGLETALRAEISMPGVSSGEGVAVCVGDDRLLLESKTYFLDVLLPLPVNPELSTAHYVADKQNMFVTMALGLR